MNTYSIELLHPLTEREDGTLATWTRLGQYEAENGQAAMEAAAAENGYELGEGAGENGAKNKRIYLAGQPDHLLQAQRL